MHKIFIILYIFILHQNILFIYFKKSTFDFFKEFFFNFLSKEKNVAQGFKLAKLLFIRPSQSNNIEDRIVIC